MRAREEGFGSALFAERDAGPASPRAGSGRNEQGDRQGRRGGCTGCNGARGVRHLTGGGLGLAATPEREGS